MNYSISFKNICISCLFSFALCSFCVQNDSCHQVCYSIKKHQNKEVVAWVKAGGDVNSFDSSGVTLLIHSVQSRNLFLLKFLLKQKLIDINYQDRAGKTALDYAVDLEGIDENSALLLQHMQYDMCRLLINKFGKVTSVERDVKLRSFLLKGKPKYDKTLLGFCVDNSSLFVSTAAACKMSFLGPFVSVVTNFLGSFASYSIDRIAHYRRLKKYNYSFLLEN